MRIPLKSNLIRGKFRSLGCIFSRMHPQPQPAGNQFSTTSSACNDKVYELRTYSLHAKDVRAFMDLSKEKMGLRLQHSRLVGYWASEVGGINDTVHIWEYDSLSHRASVRQALAADPDWVASYFSKILPMLQRQENSLMVCLPGTDVTQPPGTGFYEIENISFPNKDVRDVAAYFQTLQRPGAQLLGCFYNIVGPNTQNSGHVLWYHTNIDNPVKNPGGQGSASGILTTHSRLLLPTPWSTMQ